MKALHNYLATDCDIDLAFRELRLRNVPRAHLIAPRSLSRLLIICLTYLC